MMLSRVNSLEILVIWDGHNLVKSDNYWRECAQGLDAMDLIAVFLSF